VSVKEPGAGVPDVLFVGTTPHVELVAEALPVA
jgi:hypothetical protein